jgi:tetratricopeptide (TPR) repeat protein/S1-C subfamily serine protease
MKIQYLLLTLTASALGISATNPWVQTSQPTQLTQSAQVANNSSRQVNSQAAQAVAAKVTVRIKVGQGFGSGVLLGKKGTTYLVLTNAHVVREQADLNIQTPDGQSYPARRVKDLQVGKFDVALLEFTSTRAYQLVKIDSSRDNFALAEGTKLVAAGFARGANTLKVVPGEVKQLPQEPFVNGTQVGYKTTGDIEQGMSGGPILDGDGNLVGINSTYAYPIKPVYTYADGTRAAVDRVAEYRQANWGIPIYNLLTTLNPDILYGYKQLPKLHRTVTPSGYMAELDRKARLVTVRIENSGGNGSGVIVARDGDSYYVLTADHVVTNVRTKNKELRLNQKIITHDQRTYTIDPSQIKRSGGTDLAVVKFTSTQPYQIATLGNYSIFNSAVVFPGGWPAPSMVGSQQWQWQLSPGKISGKERGEFVTQDKLSFSNGYDLIYSSNTYGGMSGGPVFDSEGRVIGIHGKAEGDGATGNILGNSLGISIKTFMGITDRLDVPTRNLQITTKAPSNLDGSKLTSINLVRSNIAIPSNDSDADRWIEYGNQLYRLKKYTDAIIAFDRAIKLAPDSLDAYYGKGLALASNDSKAALKAFDRAIGLVPKGRESQFYYLWKYRSVVLRDSKNYQGALMAISDAIRFDGQEPPDMIMLNEKANLLSELKQYSNAIKIYTEIINRGDKSWSYVNRGVAKSALGDKKGAISDYDRAIAINPQFAEAYNNRGVVKSALGDKKSAMSDYDRAIAINPQFAEAYYSRGVDKSDLGDKKGAISDYDRAIAINPQDAKAYINRGVAKSALGDKKGAISDYDRAIAIDPQLAAAYYNRGMAKYKLGDKKGAVSDYDRAIAIDPQLAAAYSNRGIVKAELGDKKGAMSDYDRAIAIDPQLAAAYYNRGMAKYNSGDKKGAMSDFDKAIAINPQYTEAYGNRGVVKAELGDKKGAVSDFDKAIKINPKYANAYYSRGTTKSDLGDKKGAISDYDRAIAIDPQYVDAYLNRGMNKSELGDIRGSISDYDRAIVVDPKFALAYFNRGAAKYSLGDIKGAISDYDRAILIDSKFAKACVNRGFAKAKLGDRQGAIADLNIAAQIFKGQNDLAGYDRAISLIKKISN